MGIAGVGYGSRVPYFPHINSRTGKNAESQNIQPENQCSGNISLKWSDGAIFASGTPDGQSMGSRFQFIKRTVIQRIIRYLILRERIKMGTVMNSISIHWRLTRRMHLMLR